MYQTVSVVNEYTGSSVSFSIIRWPSIEQLLSGGVRLTGHTNPLTDTELKKFANVNIMDLYRQTMVRYPASLTAPVLARR